MSIDTLHLNNKDFLKKTLLIIPAIVLALLAIDPLDIFQLSNTVALILIALFSIFFLLYFILALNIHSFVALITTSFITAIMSGIPIIDIVPTMMNGIGGTLAAVALLVGLGAMIGVMLQVSGGAQVLADTLINTFGRERAPLALGIASLLFGFPIFFDAGLMVMLPVVLTVAMRFDDSFVKYAFPAAGGFAVMHAFVPPHPGPVTAAGMFGANVGVLLFYSIIVVIPTWYFGSYLYAQFLAKRFKLDIPKMLGAKKEVPDDKKPSFSLVLSILLLPLILISIETVTSSLAVDGYMSESNPIFIIGKLIGKTPIALLITVLYSLILFRKKQGAKELEKLCDDALAPICSVILVTGAGGMFGAVLRAGGIGDAIASALSSTGLPIIIFAFLIATALRLAQGSSTVVVTTTAALLAPMINGNPDISQSMACLIIIAIGCGATVFSHVNDSGFWLVSKLFGMDVKTTLKTWTVMDTLIGGFGFVTTLILSFFV